MGIRVERINERIVSSGWFIGFSRGSRLIVNNPVAAIFVSKILKSIISCQNFQNMFYAYLNNVQCNVFGLYIVLSNSQVILTLRKVSAC